MAARRISLKPKKTMSWMVKQPISGRNLMIWAYLLLINNKIQKQRKKSKWYVHLLNKREVMVSGKNKELIS